MKKTFLVSVIVVLSLLFQGCDESALNDPDVKAVRGSYWGLNRTATIGDLFDRYFDSPKWSMEMSQKGELFVVFEGKISSTSDKRQTFIANVNKCVEKENDFDLVTFLKYIAEKAPEVVQVETLLRAITEKYNSVEKSIIIEKESTITALRNEYYLKDSSIEENLQRERKELERQMSALASEKENALIPYMESMQNISKEIHRLKNIKANLRPADYRDGKNVQVEKDLDNALAQIPQISSQVEVVAAQYDEQIKQLSGEIDALYKDRLKAEDQAIIELDALTRQIDEEYAVKIEQQMEAECKPFAVKNRAEAQKIAIQLIEHAVPEKGDPIKIKWLKFGDTRIPGKVNYNIVEISSGDKRAHGYILPE